MGKRTVQEKDLSGNKQKLYLWQGSLIEPCSYYKYEVCIYKYWKGGFCQLGSKYFKSDRLLNIKHASKYKHCNGYSIEKTIELVGAPIGFIEENNLSVYKPVLKNKKSKKK